jgi:hypothetical protein
MFSFKTSEVERERKLNENKIRKYNKIKNNNINKKEC